MVLREREGIHVVESFTLGEFDGGQNTYKVVGKEVHVQEQGKPSVVVFRIEPKGDLTPFAMIEKGKREEIPKKRQRTWKRVDTNRGVVKSNSPSPKAFTNSPKTKVAIEKAIREDLEKPTGKLTNEDYEKVRYVSLRKFKFTDVEELEKCKNLEVLSLYDNKLTEAPKGLEKLTQIEYLYLNYNQLTEVPSELEKLAQLKALYLNNNKITEVKGLEKLAKLESLFLQDNKITEVKGLEKLPNLDALILYGNQLTDVKWIEKLTQLKVLNLQDNPGLTHAQIDELQKALPKCKIYRGGMVR